MLVGMVSWMDMLMMVIRHSRPTLRHGAVRLHSADCTEIDSFCSSAGGARSGRARKKQVWLIPIVD